MSKDGAPPHRPPRSPQESVRQRCIDAPPEAVVITTTNAAPSTKLLEPEISKLPIHAMESIKSGANIIAIVGGKGLRNSQGRSNNYLVRQRENFFASSLNFYLLPNPSKKKNFR